jgi:hypothetical protein
MFKLARRLVGVAIALVLLVVIIGAVVFWRIDMLAKRGVEAGASYALGVPTTVRSVDVGLLKGTVELDGLRVANPQGYASPHFLTLDDGTTAVALDSLRSDIIRIPELRLADIDVVLQKDSAGRANYQVIMENIEKLGSKDKPREPPQDEPAKEKRLIVNELVIRNITVHADLAPSGGGVIAQAAGQLGKVTIPIEEVRLTDVGKTGEGVGGSGVTIGELAGLVIEAVLAAAVEKGGDLLPADIAGDIRARLASLGNLEKLGQTVEQIGEDLKKAKTPEEIGEAVKKGREEVEKLGGGLKDLIPKKK